jgi:Crp-like helix-turn-helix protein
VKFGKVVSGLRTATGALQRHLRRLAPIEHPHCRALRDADWLRSLALTSAECPATLFRHEQLILVQAQQSAACNTTHTVETRLARWLLRPRELQGSDDLMLTQEFLAQMLGVRRTSVSLVVNPFQQAGFIR